MSQKFGSPLKMLLSSFGFLPTEHDFTFYKKNIFFIKERAWNY